MALFIQSGIWKLDDDLAAAAFLAAPFFGVPFFGAALLVVFLPAVAFFAAIRLACFAMITPPARSPAPIEFAKESRGG
jgi:hypothetical protein